MENSTYYSFLEGGAIKHRELIFLFKHLETVFCNTSSNVNNLILKLGIQLELAAAPVTYPTGKIDAAS